MSSHVRYFLQTATGGHYAGHNAIRYLRGKGFDPKNQADVIEAAKSIDAKLWIFREPRNVKNQRSRYKQVCQAFMLNNPPPRYALPDITAIAARATKKRRTNDRTNSPQRSTNRREQLLRSV